MSMRDKIIKFLTNETKQQKAQLELEELVVVTAASAQPPAELAELNEPAQLGEHMIYEVFVNKYFQLSLLEQEKLCQIILGRKWQCIGLL